MWYMCFCACESMAYVYLVWLPVPIICLLVCHQHHLRSPEEPAGLPLDPHRDFRQCSAVYGVKAVTMCLFCRGFCYFNSVAVAAKLLQQRLNVSKILIVDWVSGCLPSQFWEEHACPPVSPVDSLSEHWALTSIDTWNWGTELSGSSLKDQRSKACIH